MSDLATQDSTGKAGIKDCCDTVRELLETARGHALELIVVDGDKQQAFSELLTQLISIEGELRDIEAYADNQ